MDSRKIVLKETGIISLGVAAGTALMWAVFALLGKFDLTVLLGGLVGALLSIGNFFIMAMNTSLAADKAVNQDVKGGKSLIKTSFTVRMLVMFVLLIACVKSGLCNAIACVLPLVFVRPTITIAEFFRKPGDKE